MYGKVAPETSEEETEQPVGLAEKITNHPKCSTVSESSQQKSNSWKSLSPLHKRAILISLVFLLALGLIVVIPTAVVVSSRSRQKQKEPPKRSTRAAKQLGDQVVLHLFKLCEPNPCENNGMCIAGKNDYACLCQDGYYGNNCERQNLCDPNLCENNGTCVSGRYDYRCRCLVGFYGKNCEKGNTLCDSNPCKNNGTCVSGDKDYACNCQIGYYGNKCETERNLCDSNPCENNGTCAGGKFNYTCTCQGNYTGMDCFMGIYRDPDPGWYSPGNGYEYKLSASGQNWNVKRAVCSYWGSNLAVHGMKCLEIRRLIANNLDDFNTAFIGLVDIINEGTFFWIDGSSSTPSNTHWRTGEPDNRYNGDCALLEKSSDYLTIDDRCEGSYPAICEKKLI